VDEALVAERGRIFTILSAEEGRGTSAQHPQLRPEDVDEIGPCILARRDPLAREQWLRELGRLEEIVAQTPSERALRRLATARRAVTALAG
jgi:tRNA A22 N-methylase